MIVIFRLKYLYTLYTNLKTKWILNLNYSPLYFKRFPSYLKFFPFYFKNESERRRVSWFFRFGEKGVCFLVCNKAKSRVLTCSDTNFLVEIFPKGSSSTKIERLLTLEMILNNFSTLEVSRAFKLLGFFETRLISCSRQLPDIELVPLCFLTNKQNFLEYFSKVIR